MTEFRYRRLRPSHFRRTHGDEPVDDTSDIARKAENFFKGQDLLFERLHSEPKMKRVSHHVKRAAGHGARLVKKHPKHAAGVLAGVLLLISGGVYLTLRSPAVVTDVAGSTSEENISQEPVPQEGEQPKYTEPEFSLVYPGGNKLPVVKVSPEGTDAAYSYIDRLNGESIRVSQQVVPNSFSYNPDVELERVAKNFQATNIIQIDGKNVYHGYSEKTRVQSLVLIKKDRLIFIASPVQQTDDVWVGYITSLQ